MDTLSTEVIFDILKLLPTKDILVNCILVSKRWNYLIDSQYFYKYLYQNICPLTKIKKPKNYKRAFRKCYKRLQIRISHIMIQNSRGLCLNGCCLCKHVVLTKLINNKKLYQLVCEKSHFPPHESLIYKINHDKVSLVLNDSKSFTFLLKTTKILIINQNTQDLVGDMELIFKSYGIAWNVVNQSHFQ